MSPKVAKNLFSAIFFPFLRGGKGIIPKLIQHETNIYLYETNEEVSNKQGAKTNLSMKKGVLLLIAILSTFVLSAQDIKSFVKNQMQTYPKSRLLDIYKSCFQDYMGAEHLVSDNQMVKAYLDQELSTTNIRDLMLWYYEPCGIDSNYFRVSLRGVKEGLITEDLLLDTFIRSANGKSQKSKARSAKRPSVKSWRKRWHKIIGTIDRMKLDLPNYQEDKQFIDSILSVGKYAISHSPEYREAYHPHYRIVERSIFENEIKPRLK